MATRKPKTPAETISSTGLAEQPVVTNTTAEKIFVFSKGAWTAYKTDGKYIIENKQGKLIGQANDEPDAVRQVENLSRFK